MGIVVRKKGFLLDMHYFRAFAIINVVFLHTWNYPIGIPAETVAQSFWLPFVNASRSVLFHDSTIYFIFISGFLFHYLSTRFELIRYYKSKVLNVIVPYIILGTAAFLIRAVVTRSMDLSIASYIDGLVYGKVQLQYWYIPFISIVFLVSPLLIKLNRRIFVSLSILLMFIPLLGTRTGTDITLGQYMYFAPVYCFGMLCSMYYDDFLHICTRYFSILCIASVAFSAVLFYMYAKGVEQIWLINTESFYYLQKMAILFVVVRLLQYIKDKQIDIFDMIATYSFSIYFLHVLIFGFLSRLLFKVFAKSDVLAWDIMSTLLPVAVLVVVVAMTACMKRVFKARSRMLIGA